MKLLEDEDIGFVIQDPQWIDKGVRLDVALFELELAKSRTSAIELIINGNVSVDGNIVIKPSFNVSKNSIIKADSDDWVGRGGKKLNAFLSDINFCVKDKNCLDVGASVGGFTQALLKHGAKSITAIDVGRNQLHTSLKANVNIISLEQTDIRDFKAKEFDLVVCDLSFISIDKILNDLLRLAKSDIIVLFKPQFEVGRLAKRNKKGVVIDGDIILKATKCFEGLLSQNKLTILSSAPCVLLGKEGNIEQFYHITK